MRTRILVILLLIQSAMLSASSVLHPVPTDRSSLKNLDWFPYTFSKIAPLEWWSVEASTADIQKRNYQTDFAYQEAIRTAWAFPRFCFSLFRPSPEDYFTLLTSANQYQGGVYWYLLDGCIIASATPLHYLGHTTFVGKTPEQMQQEMEEAIRNPPKADPEFVKKAVEAIPAFCQYLEKRLNLQARSPLQFDPAWLTQEGLKAYKPESEDFYERGSWIVELMEERPRDGMPDPPEPTQDVSFSLTMDESAAILRELGAKWASDDNGGHLVLPSFPRLARLPDVIDSEFFSPEDSRLLLLECLTAQQHVKSPEAIRGLDKLVRIANRAESQHLGIYFVGED